MVSRIFFASSFVVWPPFITDSANLTEVERRDSYRFSSSRILAARSSVDSVFSFLGSEMSSGG